MLIDFLSPLDLVALLADSTLVPLSGTVASVASLNQRVGIKRAAGRPQDLDDVRRLLEGSFQQRTPQQPTKPD